MRNATPLIAAVLCCAMANFSFGEVRPKATNQVLELRTYTLVNAEAEQTLDSYLESALLPALHRQGLGPVGAFDQSGEAEEIQVMLLIAGPDAAAIAGINTALQSDEQYLKDAADYLAIPAKQPIVKRITSELLLSFDCWPEVKVPQQKSAGKDRLFELRVYESPTEHFGNLKVEMFNAGEVPIFLDCDIMPVFMGQALVGDKMPNLTYMTVYDNDEARKKGWADFRVHPDWKVLSKVAKYKGTVSKIHKSDWVPKKYSQL